MTFVGSSAATVTLNASGLAAGSYGANLCVASNDATNPLVTVPVSFTVTGGSTNACAASDTIGDSRASTTSPSRCRRSNRDWPA